MDLFEHQAKRLLAAVLRDGIEEIGPVGIARPQQFLIVPVQPPAGGAEGLEVTAPVAPGVVQPVRVSSFRLLEVGDEIAVDLVPSVLALDGEREIEIGRQRRISIRFSDQGPQVVDMNRALQLATQRSHFSSSAALAGGERQCLLAHLGICLNPCPECK